MVRDLEARALLIGLTKSEVIDRLGMPEDRDTLGDHLGYAVDPGLRTGPFGVGGIWVFWMDVRVDSLSARIAEVGTAD